jgi:hypothetical protein
MDWNVFAYSCRCGLAAVLGGLALVPSLVQASQFSETAIEPTEVIAIARPYGVETTKYDLLIIQQIPQKRQCWQTNVGTPIVVDPLLLNFDFTGSCNRATDSNGYSVRIDGQDYGLEYLLRIVPKGNELILVATSRTRQAPELTIGRTAGLVNGFMQIQLDPGWQLTKRTFNGKQLGHFYFSTTQANLNAPAPVTAPIPASSPETVAPLPSPLERGTPTPELVFPNPTAPTSVPSPEPTTAPPPPREETAPVPELVFPNSTAPTPAPTPQTQTSPSTPQASPVVESTPRAKTPTVNDFRRPY